MAEPTEKESASAGGSTPRVSVIMPVYNAGEYLRASVESIRGQTMGDWELILVDDGSTDGAVQAIAAIDDSRIRILRQENRGKPVAMNRALELVRGEFYALQDADDISHPDRLQRQLACLDAHPEVAGVFCGHEVIIDDHAVAPTFRGKSPDECAMEIALGLMPGHDPTAMYRLSAVEGIRYSEDLPVVEGFDYILRVGERFPLMVLGECLYRYRIHVASVTKNDPSRRIDLVRQVRARMRERRGLPPAAGEADAMPPRTRAQDEDNDLVSHFAASVADLIGANRRGEAIRTGLACWRLNRMHLYYAKPLVYSLVPRSAVAAWRDRKWRALKRRYERGELHGAM